MRKPHLLDLNDALQHPGRHVYADLTVELSDEEDLDLLEPIYGSIDAYSTGNRLFVNGDFHTTVVLECGMCLTPIHYPLEISIAEEFEVEGTPAGHGNQTNAHVIDEAPNGLFYGNGLLYEELVRQNLLLALPMAPLCRSDCPGLLETQNDFEEGRPELHELKKLLEQGSTDTQ